LQAEDGRKPNISTNHLSPTEGLCQVGLCHAGPIRSFCKVGGSWFLPTNSKMRKYIIKYLEYIYKMEHLPDKVKFYFLYEKHLINKDVLPNKTKVPPSQDTFIPS
jgi:hypothetical protein